MVDYKEIIDGVLGPTIVVVWINFALLGPRNTVFLAVASSLKILLVTESGGLII